MRSRKARAALAAANAALAASLAVRASIKTTIPADAPEDHEDNSFQLPAGNPILKRMRRFFRDQLKRMVGFIAKIGAEIPAVFPRMADYNDPIASAMTPILGVYWDKAGKGLRGRLGLDPDEWRVTDPNIHRAIADQALKLAASTNATTDLAIDEAREQLRQQLAAGLISHGETVDQLTARVKTIFKRATDHRARMIAQTEAARAVHAAGEMSAIDSGVVEAKRWLLSANSCPVCVNLAQKAGDVPLGSAFGMVGKDPAYATVRYPPAHPFCRCSMTYVLIDSKPDAAAYVATPKKPRSKAQAGAEQDRGND